MKKNLYVAFFSDTVKARSFKLCMIITLLGVYVFKVTGLSEKVSVNCTFMSLFRVLSNVVWLLHTLKSYTIRMVRLILCSREIIYTFFFICQVSRLCQKLYIGSFSDTMNVINVKLCIVLLHIEFYLFIILSMTLTEFQDHSSANSFKGKCYVLIQLINPLIVKLCRTIKYIKQVLNTQLLILEFHTYLRERIDMFSDSTTILTSVFWWTVFELSLIHI